MAPLIQFSGGHKNLDLNDFVCFLDDDNVYEKDYLKIMVEYLDKNSQAGIALCGANDLRYNQNLDGYPEDYRCDNSAFMARREVVKTIEFPRASMDKNVVQDCEYIKLCAKKFGFVNVPYKLLIFGVADNIPPNRGGINFLESWKEPQKAFELALQGKYDGSVRSYSGTKKIFYRFLEKYGFKKYNIHFHGLRHTYSNMLFEADTNPKVIQALLGHKSVKTTITTYNSVDKSYFQKATDVINKQFSSEIIKEKQDEKVKVDKLLDGFNDEELDKLTEMLEKRKQKKQQDSEM
jgi:hypothetical protein